jgi:hypothetical protein
VRKVKKERLKQIYIIPINANATPGTRVRVSSAKSASRFRSNRGMAGYRPLPCPFGRLGQAWSVAPVIASLSLIRSGDDAPKDLR